MLTSVFRDEAARVTAALMRRFGDFDLAEESAQDALVAALESWPERGIPDRPGAWLMTVGSRLAVNRLEREKRYRQKLDELTSRPEADREDDRLRLIFTCCHPALSREAQVGLTLRAVCGLTTTEIARAFLASEATVAQRLVRAKRRIAAAGIPYRMPSPSELSDRLDEVLAVLYLMFNEAHLSTDAASPVRRDLADDALWLTALLNRLLPGEPEVLGLLAVMKLHLARGSSRFDPSGGMVLLPEQDRSRWDQPLIKDAVHLIEMAATMRQPGPYQLEAAIAACHIEAPSYEQTDWPQIVALYDMLVVLAPSPVVRMNRAIALSKIDGPRPALDELSRLAKELDHYYLFHAVRGDLLGRLGDAVGAQAAQARALELTRNPAEQSLLRERLFR